MPGAVIYVSYDGATDPLGRSQVVAYLTRLAGEFEVTLISFEKRPPTPSELIELREAGIRWVPLRYHARPPVASTAVDIAVGARALARELRGRREVVVHARSYVAADVVLRCPPARRARFLFDIRGFWVDERLEGGIWRPGVVSRYARRRERRFYERADAIVTLTRASVPTVRSWMGNRTRPITVIPTCAAVDLYAGTLPRPDGSRLVWAGSIGTRYRFDLAVRAARASGVRMQVLSAQTQAADELMSEIGEVGFVPHERLPENLHAGDVGLCLIKAGFSTLASSPTRFAEYLAAGMPVIVSAGIGDLDHLVSEERVGVVLRSEDDGALREAVGEALRLGNDPAARDRCREVAGRLFSIDQGARAYADLYRQLLATGSDAPSVTSLPGAGRPPA